MCSKVLLEEFNYFLENKEELFKQYPYKILVIKNKKVIGLFETVPEAVKETSKTEQLGTFLVQKCDIDPNSYTMWFYSPRVAFN